MGRKVLVLTSTFPRWSGDSTPGFVYELCRRLAALGNNVAVLAPHHRGARYKQKTDGLIVHRFRYFFPESMQKLAYGAGILPNIKGSLLAGFQVPFFLLSEFAAAGKLAGEFKPELIHAHWLIPQGAVAAVLKRKLGIPLIVTVHGSDLFPIKNPLLKKIQNFVLENCDLCTVNSEATRKEILKRFPHCRKKIVVIPMGVDVEALAQKKNKGMHATVLFVGRLNEQKGIRYLIKAMAIVRARHPDAKLIIIGEGGYMREMKRLSSSLNISNIVKFLGGKSHEEVVKHYKTADVFVLPSIESGMGTEALGLSLLEAMAAGVPVIGTNTGGIRYIIRDGHNGLIARQKSAEDLAKCIIKFLTDAKLRAKCISNALKFVRKGYEWGLIANKFEKLYSGLK